SRLGGALARIDEGDPAGFEASAGELGQQAVADGFGSDAGAIRDVEDWANFGQGRSFVWNPSARGPASGLKYRFRPADARPSPIAHLPERRLEPACTVRQHPLAARSSPERPRQRRRQELLAWRDDRGTVGARSLGPRWLRDH